MNNYSEFCIQVKHYESFVYSCFKEYTKGWLGYPGIESIDFEPEKINFCYSVWDDKDYLHIPVEFIQNNDIQGVVAFWQKEAERIRQERLDKQKKEQEARELAEFVRLQAKFSGNTGNERIKS